MTILLLAPHPFYQARGTPIAVDWLLRALSDRGARVDVVTYHEGTPVRYPGVTIHRIPAPPFIRNIRPGFSFKKLICDLLLCVRALQLCRRGRYHVTHCIEESVYIGMLLKALFRTPYVYDMDSSLPQQMVERYPVLKLLAPVLNACEGLAVRGAAVVVPVCDALASTAERYRPARVIVLRDISLLGRNGRSPTVPMPRPSPATHRQVGGRRECREPQADGRLPSGQPLHQAVAPPPSTGRSPSKTNGLVLVYVGNLEPYQGIDLLLDSFALARRALGQGRLLVIGGQAADIARYQAHARRLTIADHVGFLGPKPVDELGAQLSQADILVSPRIRGRNTPMKIYSYLHSGRPILATKLTTHTQVLTDEVSLLADPRPETFSQGMVRLMTDPGLRARLGQGGHRLAEDRYSYRVFTSTVDRLCEAMALASARQESAS